MTEPELDAELSDQDRRDLESLVTNEEAPKYTVMETWAKLLDSIETAELDPINPMVAMRQIGNWPHLTFADLDPFYAKYHSFLKEMREVIRQELLDNPELVLHVEDDAAYNHENYVNVIRQWHVLVSLWESEWRTSDADAGIGVAAIAEAQQFTLGQQGLVNYLAHINLMFTPADREIIAEAVASVWENAAAQRKEAR